ncbi:cytochrome P450 family hydroxylase [Rhizoctonia solani AG-3 Rhs1AP]|uniref:Cytochrome P450 family hydroxylase n=1 Tax=Rhizoctonia solani AG-3 Rhs1AP TaxID=1086054 RepID=X8JKY6_9AGAM|nr:cytochrome P450 family hydroxylase [Rhizoctonia solani AG-3 Rhs1AP]
MGYILTLLRYALLSVVLLIGVAACYFVRILFILPLFDPMRKLSGPKSRGLLVGDMYLIMNANRTPQTCDKLVKTYGKTMKISGFGSWDPRLYTLDQRALTYILNNSTKYQKPWQSQRIIGNLIGYGMLATEGATHRIQKKVITPAFSSANLQDFLPIFFGKAKELRAKWDNITVSDGENGAEIDVYHWMSRVTFDIIGLAGFDYAFNATENEENPVYLAYKEMFAMTLDLERSRGLISMLISVYFPIFYKIFPDKPTKVVTASHRVIYGMCRELVETKREAVLREMESGDKTQYAKDLLSRLLRSNLSTDLPESQRLTDNSLMDNINTMLFAGSDTTSLSLGWTLFLLANHPEYQTSLREELAGLQDAVVDPYDPSIFSALDELPKLNNVIRESLRLIPPVHSSLRVATENDIIPTSEPVRLHDGTFTTNGVHIKKGTYVHIALEGINLVRDVWGEDADLFRPERWDNIPEAVKANPSIYGGMMTFSHGPRACMGFRFSVMVMKTFLYFMISSYHFEPTMKITMENNVMVRPYPNGEWQKPSRLPLRVTRIRS